MQYRRKRIVTRWLQSWTEQLQLWIVWWLCYRYYSRTF